MKYIISTICIFLIGISAIFAYSNKKVVAINPIIETKIEDSIEPMLGDSGDGLISTAGDGQVSNTSVIDWPTTHESSVGTTYNYVQPTTKVAAGYYGLFSWWEIDRVFLPFDTSSVPSNAIISSASLKLYIPSSVLSIIKNTDDSYAYIDLVQTSQGSSIALATKDFNETGATTTPTLGATHINMSDMATSTWVTFNLNSTGLSWIKKSGETSNCGTTSGVTCLGLREGHDSNNITMLSSNGINWVIFNTSEAASNQPYLTVIFTVPPTNGSTQIRTNLQLKSGVLQIKK